MVDLNGSRDRRQPFPAGPRSHFGSANLSLNHIFIVGGQDDETKKGLKTCYVWNISRNRWSTKGEITDLPVHMSYCRATVLDGFVYVLGDSAFYKCSVASLVGGKINKYISKVKPLQWEKLTLSKNDDIATNQKICGGIGFEWISSPTTRCLYRIGGMADPNGMKRYDPSKDVWEDMPKLIVGRYHFSCVCTSDDVIHVMGGICAKFNKQVLSSVETFNLNGGEQTQSQQGRWVFGHDIPIKTCYASATFLTQNNMILLIGGRTSLTAKARATCYNTSLQKDNGWQEFPHHLSHGFAQHTSILFGEEMDTVLIMGGVSNNSLSSSNDIFLYDATIYFKEDEDSLGHETTCTSSSMSIKESTDFEEGTLSIWKRISCTKIERSIFSSYF